MEIQKTTLSKIFADIPFSHRQPSHSGHCAFSHGHNWTFEFFFKADLPDQSGFILDFGDLKWLKDWLTETFDHAHLFAESDFEAKEIIHHHPSFFKARFLPEVSCEGIAEFTIKAVNRLLERHYPERRVRVAKLILREDSKNSCEVIP